MADELGALRLDFSVEDQSFRRSLGSMTRAMRALDSEFDALRTRSTGLDDQMSRLQSTSTLLSRKMEIQRAKVEELKRQYEESARAKGNDSREAQNLLIQYNRSLTQLNRMEQRLNSTNEAIQEQATGLGELRRSADQNIGRMSSQIDLLNARYDASISGMRNFGNSAQDLRLKEQHLTRTFELQEQTANELQRVFEETRRVRGRDARETQDAERAYLSAITTMRRTGLELEDLQGQIRDQTSAWGRLRSRITDAGETMQDYGGRMQSAGSGISQSFGAATLAIGGGLAFASKKAMDFESQMSSVKSVMSPDEVQQFGGELEKLAVKMGADTKYSALEAAQGIEELIKAGVQTTDIINGGLDGALSLATAGELELADAAEIASTALNAFRDDNLTVMQAADLLAGAANASATSVSEMQFGLSQVSAVAAGAGLSFKDTATSLAVFAQNGLKGSDAGTSLKTMLSNLIPKSKEAWGMFEELGLMSFDTAKGMEFLADQGIKPVSNSMEDVQKAIENYIMKQEGVKKWNADCEKSFQGLGISTGFLNNAFYDTNGNIEEMSTIADALKESMKDLSAEQRQQALYTLFGSDAVRAGTILFKEGAAGVDAMATAMGKVKSADVAAEKLNNVKGRLEQLKGSVETAAISLGNALLPTIDKVVGGVQKATDWFNNLDPAMQNTIATTGLVALGITGVTTALGLGLSVVGGAVTGFGALAGTLGLTAGTAGAAGISIGAIAWPVTAAIAAIGGLTAAGVYLYQNWDDLTKSQNRWKLALFGVLPGVNAVVGAIKAYEWGMQESIPTATKFGDNVSSSTQKAIGGFVKLRDEALAALSETFIKGDIVTDEGAKNLIGKFDAMGNEIKSKMKAHFDGQFSNMQSFFQSSGALTDEEEAKILTRMQENNSNKQAEVQKHEDRIVEIINKAKSEKRKISDSERAEINGIQAAMAQTAVNTLSQNEVEQKAIMEGLRQSAKGITAQQAGEVVGNANKQKDEAIKKANEQYIRTVDYIKLMRDQNIITSDDQANAMIADAERMRNESVRKAKNMHTEVVKEAKKQAGGHVHQVNWTTGQVKTKWEVMRDTAARKMGETASSVLGSWNKLSSGVSTLAVNAANGAITGINGMITAVNFISKHLGLGQISRISKIGSNNGSRNKDNRKYTGRRGQYAYAEGTPDSGHPGGLAIVSEEGRELIHEPGVGVYLSGNKGPELRNLRRGSSVLPNKETEKLLKSHGFPGYEKGTGDFFSWVSGGSKKVVENALRSLGVKGINLPGGYKGIGRGMFSFIKSGMVDFFKEKVKDFFSFDTSGASGNVRGWIQAAISATGVPASWASGLVTIAMKESGGNPRAYNNWDINAKRGIASRGLMQTIPPTFNAYKLPGMGNIFNPIHNAAAAIRYIQARYGDISNVPGLRSMRSGGAYRGYWTGIDNVPYDQIAMVGEQGRELVGLPGGSKVFNNSETNRILSGRNVDISPVTKLLEVSYQIQQDMLNALLQLLEKGTDVLIDGDSLQSTLEMLQTRNQAIQQGFGGRG